MLIFKQNDQIEQQQQDKIDQMLEEYCKKYNVDKDVIINNPEWQDNDDQQTFAMYLAQNNIIPPKQFSHNSTTYNNDGNTIAVYLEINNIQVPQQWKYDPEYRLKDNSTTAIQISQYSKIPSQYWEHKSEIQNKWGHTVSLNLAKQGITPPIQWYHSPYIPDEDEKTVQDYLIENKIQVPEQWKIINKQIQISDEIQQQLNKYCEECEIQNQQIVINYPQYQKYEWNDTFGIYLELHNIQIPEQFLYNPEFKLLYEETSAMKISQQGKIPSKYWQHNPIIQDTQGYTVAMWLAYKGIIPSDQWQHDPKIQNYWKDTVGILLAYNGIKPPKQWMHDINITNIDDESIRSYLLSCGYVFINNQFFKLNQNNISQYVQVKIMNDICQICLEEGEQEFIISNCSHKICLKCFKEMINNNEQKIFCPICKQLEWFVLVEQNSQQ